MLNYLRIQNFALIEQTDIVFNNGLTVITGETGAGKSIILGALHIALGARAETNLLNDKSRKCIIEAQFNIQSYQLKPFFDLHELDFEELTTLRREITPEGKSRAFVNDTPVNVSVLKQLGEFLIDIHSQHETLLLKETGFQFELLDHYAQCSDLFSNYKKQYQLLLHLKKQLELLSQQELQAKKELDYLQFQYNELEEANLKTGELQSLEEESKTLENAEIIKNTLHKTSQIINHGDDTILTAIAQAKQQLQSISKYGKQFQELYERLNSASIELKELANDVENSADDVVFNNERLEVVNTQLDKINRLLKKHHVNSEDELLQIKQDIEQSLQQFSSLESNIEKINKNIITTEKQCQALATELSTKRKKSISNIEQQIKTMLGNLSMPNAQFKIELVQNKELSINGLDSITFLFTANKGMEFKALHKTASGGELSRLMLCLKALLAERKALPTIIFDEIDTGVSGDVADKIGQIMLSMGKQMQVMVITHLPQMASKGNNHLYVYKTDTHQKTVTSIKPLNEQERIAEIAKMLSTGSPSEIAVKNAKELLNA